MGKHHALARDAILAALTAYTGVTTADGATPANNTLICAGLIGSNDFVTEKTVLIGSGNAEREDSGASSFNPVTGEITVATPFGAQIKAGVIFRVLNISSVEIDVDVINTKIGTNTDPAGTTTLFAWLANIFSGAGGISAILALVNAMLTLTETGGTVTTDGTEQDVYINNAPAGVYRPICVKINTANHTAAETIVIREYYRTAPGGAYLRHDTLTFAGVIAEEEITVDLDPNRFGVKVTIEKTAGVNRAYDWEVHYKV